MATFTVTEQSATGAGSLAAAIAAAQANAGPDRIVFAADVTRIVTAATLTIDSNIVIDGDRNNDGVADVTISSDIDVDGTGNHTLFALGTGANVTFDGLVFTKGFDAGTSAADVAVGALLNNGTATIRNSQFLENQAVGWAGQAGANGSSDNLSGGNGMDGGAAVGAILNRGTMSIQNTRFAENSGIGGSGGAGGNGAPQIIYINGTPVVIGGGGGGDGGNGAVGAGAIVNFTAGSLNLSGVALDDNTGRAGNGGNGGDAHSAATFAYGGIGGAGAHGSASILDFGSMSGSATRTGGSFSGGIGGELGAYPPDSDYPYVRPDGFGGLQPTRIGTTGNDARTGLAFSEMFAGLSGDDTFVASGGSDLFNGGDGIDTVVFSAVAAGVTFNLGSATSQSIGIGKLTAVGVENATGGSGDDVLIGSGGANTLSGMAGNDILNSAGGGDTLIGGTGNDFYHVNANDTIVELANEGSDTVNAHQSFVLAAGVRVERLQVNNPAGVFARDLTGNEFAQTIVGGAGINVLKGGGGNDVIYGLAGADTMQGDAGNDTFFVDNAGDFIVEAAGGGTGDVVASSISYVLNAGAEVETLRTTSNGGTASIDLTGNAFDQTIIGNNGANMLRGGGGQDTLQGLGGNDTYRIFAAGDVIVESISQGSADKVVAAVDYRLAAGVHVEIMLTNGSTGKSGIDLTGNEFAQTITGNAGDNRLEGKGGADQLRGLGGADTFVFATKLGGGNIDAILDFSVPDDRFLLSDAIFTALNTGTLAASAFRANTTGLAGDATDRIIYETDTGKVFYDADGTGATAGIHFATITAGLALTNADFSVA
jgi:hypothetical protein